MRAIIFTIFIAALQPLGEQPIKSQAPLAEEKTASLACKNGQEGLKNTKGSPWWWINKINRNCDAEASREAYRANWERFRTTFPVAAAWMAMQLDYVVDATIIQKDLLSGFVTNVNFDSDAIDPEMAQKILERLKGYGAIISAESKPIIVTVTSVFDKPDWSEADKYRYVFACKFSQVVMEYGAFKVIADAADEVVVPDIYMKMGDCHELMTVIPELVENIVAEYRKQNK